MIDVSELMDDPDFATSYTVWRKSGRWVAGEWEQTEQSIPFYGPVQPPTSEDLELIPEADRKKGIMNFLSRATIYTTGDTGTSDEAEYQGNRYKILQVKQWNGWCRATGVRI